MTETPVTLLAKAKLHDVRLHIGRSGLSLGDAVELALDAQGKVIVRARVQERVLGVFRRTRCRTLGHLGPAVDRFLAPLVETEQALRVRVVGLTPEHLSASADPEVFVSIWGAPGQTRKGG